MTDEIKYKFTNPTPGWVGAVVLNEDNKPHGIPVAPGDSVWLSRTEQRLTAEAPRDPRHNPFVAEWKLPVAWSDDGEPTAFEGRSGTLVLSQEPPRPIHSERALPDLAQSTGLGGPAAANGERPVGPPEAPEVIGAPPIPSQPPVVGQPTEEEVIATPDAPAANDEALARAAAEAAEARAAAAMALKQDAATSGRARTAAKPSTPALI